MAHDRPMAKIGRPKTKRGDEVKTTLRLPPELLKAAKIYAIQHDLSLNDTVAQALSRLIGLKEAK